MAEERVRIEVADHVATVTLARPDKHNALDIPMFEGIIGAAERLGLEPGLRAVVLHGEGPSFCSGIDVAGLVGADGGLAGLSDTLREEPPNWFQRAAFEWFAPAGSRDRRGPRQLLRRWTADRARRGHSHRPPRTRGYR
jgi:enoyl-CoA hydratase/carnithine racemase